MHIRSRIIPALLFCISFCTGVHAQTGAGKPSAEALAAYTRGRAKMEAKDYSGAQTAFSQAIIFSPAYVEAYMSLAEARRAAGVSSFDIRIEQYSKVMSIAPDYWKVYEVMGRICLEEGGWSCSQYYEELIRRQPAYAPGYLGLAKSTLYGMKGNNHAVRVRAEALPALRKAIALNRSGAEAYRELGYAWAILNNDDSAVAAYDKAIALEPRNPAPHLLKGDLYYTRKSYMEAWIAYTKAVALDSKRAGSYSKRGLTDETRGDYTEALDDYNTALRLNNTEYPALMGRGRIYRRQQQYSLAVQDFTAAMAAGKRDDVTAARLERATTYREAGQLAACGEDIGAVYLAIGQSNALYPAASYEYGRYYEATKKYDPAKRMYEQALAAGESAEVRAALNRVQNGYDAERSSRPAATYSGSSSSGQSTYTPAPRKARKMVTQRCSACKGEGKIYYEKLAVGGGLSSGGSQNYSTVNQYGTKTYGSSSGYGSVKCTACNGKGTVEGYESDDYDDY